jgi:hypothetical protein
MQASESSFPKRIGRVAIKKSPVECKAQLVILFLQVAILVG